MRLRRNLQLLAVHDLLEGFLDERLDDLLTNGVLEASLHHRRRRLARTKPRKANARGISSRCLVFGVADGLNGNTNLDEALETVGFLGRYFDVHDRIS